jgi:4-amino-4-deoxychorismate lyase
MYWYYGQLIMSNSIELDINDPGLLYGATAFTTFRTNSLAASTYDLHQGRLQSSIEDLGWYQPDWDQVRSGVDSLIPNFPILRVTVFPDGRELITGRALPPDLATWQQVGVTVIIADRQFTRSLPQHKTGNYLAPWLALQQARNHNIQEAILTNDQGDWLETTTGNLWGYRDHCWYTPPLSAGILPGIRRSQVLSDLQQHHHKVVEIDWSPEWVKDLEAISYSNSVIHLIPIHTVVTPVGKLKYGVPHSTMQWLVTL